MRYLILFCTLGVLSSHSFAQTVDQEREIAARVEAIRQRELVDSKKAKLWKYADSYKRLVKLRVMKGLGILPAPDRSEGNEPLFIDTVVNVSNTTSSQNETTIAINRKDKNIIIAGANDAAMYSYGMPVYRTTTGGKNWIRPTSSTNRVKPPSGYVSLGDPIITCDNEGTFYYSFLSVNTSLSLETSNLSVSRSTDGKTWEQCANVIESEEYFEDKEMIVTDNSPASQWYGRIYIVWNRFDADFNRLLTLAWSDDKGESWELSSGLETSTQFPVVKVGPKGEVVIGCSVDILDDQGELESTAHVLFVSTDGATSFKKVLHTDYDDLPINLEGRPSLKGDNGPRVYPFTHFDIDLKTGAIYHISGTWNGNASQLMYRYSVNMGTTWTDPQIIGIAHPSSNDADKDRFFPSVSVDQKTGEAYVLYYSSEQDPDNLLTGVLRQRLTPVLTARQRQVSALSFDPTAIDAGQGVSFIGDYIGSDAFDSMYAACWTANKPPRNDGEVYVYVSNTIQPDSLTGDVLPTVIHSSRPVISWITPNPAHGDRISVSYFSPITSQVIAELFSLDGKFVGTLFAATAEAGTSTLDLLLPEAPNGSYFLKITSPHGIAERQLILFR